MNIYFETIKCKDYEAYNIHYHIKRMVTTVGINFNLQEYIYPPSAKLYKCKVSYNESEIISISYDLFQKRNIRTFKIIYNNDITYNKKYTNRDELNDLYSKRENADEIIIVKNNYITDTSIANIAIFDGISWTTPKKPLLQGTTKNRYVEEKKLKEKNITLAMLKKAKKIALLNAMIDFNILDDFDIIV
jgi:4-amino-4-deoxychorismate lyase